MAYNTGYANIIQGLGQFAQGYAQGQRMREEDAMRKAQFEQQQQLHGLRLQEAQNKMQNEQIAQRASMLARATMTGDWQTASALHNEMTGGTVTSVSENDANSVKLTRPDGTFSVVPKLEYASIISAGNDLGLMRQSIGNIMNAESRMEQIEARAKAAAEENAKKYQQKSDESAKEREAKAVLEGRRLEMMERIARIRSAARASGGGSRGAAQGEPAKVREVRAVADMFEKEGMSKDDAMRKARDIVYRQEMSPREREIADTKLVMGSTEISNPAARKAATEYIGGEVQRIIETRKPRGPVSKTGGTTQPSGSMPALPKGFKIVR